MFLTHALHNIIRLFSCLPIMLKRKDPGDFTSYMSLFYKMFLFLIKGNRAVTGLQTISNQIKSNHFYCHITKCVVCTSALVSEILMSVLQTVQKKNRQFTYGQTVQKKQQTIYIWTDSAKKTTNNLHMDRQCKKKKKNYIWTDSAKKQQTIYIWTDSAKKKKKITYGQTVQKNNKQFTYGQTVQKNCTGAFTVLQTVQKKQQQQFTYGQTVQKNNSNLHMDSTYLQTVQKTMCKIHIHILSTHSVL